jgi:hypothetical protein
VLGVQQWAEVGRLVLVGGRSQREVARLTGLARDVAKAVHVLALPPKRGLVAASPAGGRRIEGVESPGEFHPRRSRIPA